MNLLEDNLFFVYSICLLSDIEKLKLELTIFGFLYKPGRNIKKAKITVPIIPFVESNADDRIIPIIKTTMANTEKKTSCSLFPFISSTELLYFIFVISSSLILFSLNLNLPFSLSE